MRVLVIEEEAAFTGNLELLLGRAGFVADTVDDGGEGYDLARSLDYDAILLGLRLADMSGEDVLRRLRQGGIATPVLMLTGEDASDSVVRAFSLGADDYITRPFRPDELIARLRNAVRRSRGLARPVIETGRLTLDLTARTAEVDGKALNVTAKEYAVLELLGLRKGHVISRETLLDHLYGGLDEPETRTVDVHICHLRRKLAAACDGESYIHTAWGRGFTLRDPAPDRQPIAA